ncbi:hypothetical protein BJ322DRAFT_364892 [Thelephora terrestris]|uniref:Uncharacterized protein n=1 Tax=Thelephora terrestris TaxID=56493 RepID=A0A9P6H5Q5_9AGAM|nr:hypothetical protein BJ322DRAFT_364892 [Thelephora terrestris]
MHDPLLQRKERLLQRRRLYQRLVWDIGAWMLLIPVGGGCLVWAGGRLAGLSIDSSPFPNLYTTLISC